MAGTIRAVAVTTLAVLTTFLVAVLVVPRMLGWSAYVVTSGSMSPTFEAGAVVVTAPTAPADIAVDDIVTFADPDGYTTHRVVSAAAESSGGVEAQSFTTKGDANEEADPMPLDPRNVVGKAKFAVPHVGYLVDFVRSPLGAGLLAALFLFGVFGGRSGSEHPHAGRRNPAASRSTVAVR
jgi:signal peptidase